MVPALWQHSDLELTELCWPGATLSGLLPTLVRIGLELGEAVPVGERRKHLSWEGLGQVRDNSCHPWGTHQEPYHLPSP